VCDNVSDQIGGTNLNVLRYQAEYPEQISHEVGQRDGFALSVKVGRDDAGYLTRGPVLGTAPAGRHRATWRLALDSDAPKGAEVVDIEVRSGDRSLARKVIRRRDFSRLNVWQSFSLSFDLTEASRLEFVTRWPGRADVKLDHVTLNVNKGHTRADAAD